MDRINVPEVTEEPEFETRARGIRWRRNLKKCVIVWYDVNPDVNRTVDLLESKLRLRFIIDFSITFHDIDKCIEYISGAKQDSIFCILAKSSSSFIGETLLLQLTQLLQVKSIYTLTDKALPESTNMPCGGPLTFDNEETMFQRLREDILSSHNHLSSFNILHSSIVSSEGVICNSAPDENGDIVNKNKQEASFMYSGLICSIFIKMRTECNEVTDYGKQDMVEQCRSKFENDEIIQTAISDFEQNYKPNKTINWYTRDSFVYRTIGEALRERDTIVLYKLRFFIVDLYLQLHSLYSTQSNLQTSPCVLYRAQRIKKTEFELMKSNVGGLLSFDYPLSTTVDREVANMYITPAETAKKDGEESLFFEIQIKEPNKSRTPFANIEELSRFPDEKETLISMGAVFRIGSIKQLPNGLWIVSLTLTDESDKHLAALSAYIREEIGGATNLAHLGKLMSQMAKYNEAMYFYEIILHRTKLNEHPDLYAFILDELGTIARMRGSITDAIDLYTTAVRIMQGSSPINNSQLANTYANLGHLCLQIGGSEALKMAFDHFKNEYKIANDILSENPQHVARCCSNAAMLWTKQRNYVKALKHYEQEIQLLTHSIHTAHPSIALVLNNMGTIHILQENYTDARRCFDYALQIQQISLLPNHPAFINTYRNLAKLSLQQDNFAESINYITKALDIAILQKDYDDLQIKQLQADSILISNKVEESVKHCLTTKIHQLEQNRELK